MICLKINMFVCFWLHFAFQNQIHLVVKKDVISFKVRCNSLFPLLGVAFLHQLEKF